MKELLKKEFINGKTWFDWLFLAFGLLLQIIAIIYGFVSKTPDSIWSIIAAISGVISVVFFAEGKISSHLFGFIQLFTYTLGVALPTKLYGEVWENVFYFITEIIAVFTWYKSYHTVEQTQSTEIKAKKLNVNGFVLTTTIFVFGTTILMFILRLTQDPLPFLDSLSTIPAFIAQILMVLGYREQWIYWLILDIASVVMFFMLGNWIMVTMFIFWCINCIYGYFKWSKMAIYE